MTPEQRAKRIVDNPDWLGRAGLAERIAREIHEAETVERERAAIQEPFVPADFHGMSEEFKLGWRICRSQLRMAILSRGAEIHGRHPPPASDAEAMDR